MLRRIRQALGSLLLLAGLCLLALPVATQLRTAAQNRAAVREFAAQASSAVQADPAAPSPAPAATPQPGYRELLAQMQAYNAEICANGQQGMVDAFSYRDNLFDFAAAGLPDDMIGYLSIPALGQELPLYIGANTANLAKGVAVLSQTSMPIGGADTNCVIAGHRGYNGAQFLLEIEALAPGDTVQLTNLWQTLTYQVAKCIVISPDDLDAIRIQPGQDMLTLVTCHPYGKNYQRYVVYCVRAEPDDPQPAATPALPDGQEYQSSEGSIHRSLLLNYAALAGFALLLGVQGWRRWGRRKKGGFAP